MRKQINEICKWFNKSYLQLNKKKHWNKQNELIINGYVTKQVKIYESTEWLKMEWMN